MANPNCYKWCAVPMCTNTTIKTPEKLFLCLPSDEKRRKLWVKAARREPVSMKSALYYCEDHFERNPLTKMDPVSKIYADYNATTPLAPEVVEAIAASLTEDWGNPSSGHHLGQKAKEATARARRQVAEMVGGQPNQITFMSGGTEANNTVIFGLGGCPIEDGCRPHIITSNIEHDSVELPLAHLEKLGRVTVTRVKVKQGVVDVSDVMSAIVNNTVLITIMAANNETGVLMPIHEIGQQLKHINSTRRRSIYFHSDAAQIIGKQKINVNECNLDGLTIVGHKFYGPRIGALWSRIPVPPLLFGGGQEESRRPGTENTPMIVGLGAASQLVSDNLAGYMDHMAKLKEDLEERLKRSHVLKAVVNCECKDRLLNTVNVSFPHPSLTGAMILNSCRRVLAGVGAACHSSTSSGGSAILLKSGVVPSIALSAVRLSLGRDQSEQEISEIVADLEDAVLGLLDVKGEE